MRHPVQCIVHEALLCKKIVQSLKKQIYFFQLPHFFSPQTNLEHFQRREAIRKEHVFR